MPNLTHSTLIALGLVAGSISVANAEQTTNETVVHDTTSWVEVDLNASTVLCSAADYGALFLKVGIPELARITLLDHQNIGAGAPCVAAGICAPGNQPSDIINPAKPTELVSINVKAVRYDVADSEANTCTTHLIERVHLTIRGIEFNHERFSDLGSRKFADCSSAAPAPSGGGSAGGSGDDKSDGTGASAPKADNGGCSATNNSSLFVLLLVGAITLIAARKRA
jgi:hypothetical protein